MYKVSWPNHVPLVEINRLEKPTYCLAIEDESDEKPWYHDIKNYLQKQEYPTDASNGDKRTLRRLASSFFLDGEVLYKRNYELVLL
ncbi:hypothetical protein A2U01_0068787, partial [Trifolium medium]|nr:hypothetical protein [Trifolium medium]